MPTDDFQEGEPLRSAGTCPLPCLRANYRYTNPSISPVDQQCRRANHNHPGAGSTNRRFRPARCFGTLERQCCSGYIGLDSSCRHIRSHLRPRPRGSSSPRQRSHARAAPSRLSLLMPLAQTASSICSCLSFLIGLPRPLRQNTPHVVLRSPGGMQPKLQVAENHGAHTSGCN